MLSDSSIRELIKAGVLANATKANVCPISYDLLTLEFYPKDGGATELELLSGGIGFYRIPGPAQPAQHACRVCYSAQLPHLPGLEPGRASVFSWSLG